MTALLIKCPDDPCEFMMKAVHLLPVQLLVARVPCCQWLLEQDRYDRGEFGRPVDEAELAKLRTLDEFSKCVPKSSSALILDRGQKWKS